jgi:GNAT superfamily N-acetyltransferase
LSGALSCEIRVSQPADAGAVSALLEASYPSLLAKVYDKDLLGIALPLMTKANPKLLASGTFYIAELSDGQLAGCGGWTMERPGDEMVEDGEAHIRHFATHPGWTRKGIGAALLSRCIEEARARGVKTLSCYSTLAAENFYRASGFETIKPFRITLRPGVEFPSLLMRRKLG